MADIVDFPKHPDPVEVDLAEMFGVEVTVCHHLKIGSAVRIKSTGQHALIWTNKAQDGTLPVLMAGPDGMYTPVCFVDDIEPL